MTGHIAVLGIFVADASFRADRQPKIGETLLGNSFALGPGGKGSNQAVAAARAGGDVHFITRLGQDVFADMARKVWADAGVAPSVIEDPDIPTGAAGIFIDEHSGNNAIIVCPGAAGALSAADVEAKSAVISDAAVFITQLEQPLGAAMRGLEIAKANGTQTILNTAPAMDLTPDIFPLCDFVTPNESEAEGITGIKVTDVASATKAAGAFLDLGVGTAIITLGESGVLVRSKDETFHVPAFAAGPVVETTGAGDAFNGGFAVAIADGKSLAEAARFGCATAGISVTRAGAAASMPTRVEIDALSAK